MIMRWLLFEDLGIKGPSWFKLVEFVSEEEQLLFGKTPTLLEAGFKFLQTFKFSLD